MRERGRKKGKKRTMRQKRTKNSGKGREMWSESMEKNGNETRKQDNKK